jgi:hypothetical protein
MWLIDHLLPDIKAPELSKDGNNKFRKNVTVRKMFSKGSFYECSLFLWDALVAAL